VSDTAAAHTNRFGTTLGYSTGQKANTQCDVTHMGTHPFERLLWWCSGLVACLTARNAMHGVLWRLLYAVALTVGTAAAGAALGGLTAGMGCLLCYRFICCWTADACITCCSYKR
jgi:hypothetical protein